MALSAKINLSESIVEAAALEWFGALARGDPVSRRHGTAIPADAQPTIKRYLQVRIEGNQNP
jgi:hypothetical protein